MYSTQGRTEAHHVETWIFLGEEAALQSGMDGTYLRFFAEQLFVFIDSKLQEGRVRIGLPAWVTLIDKHIGTCE